MRFFRTRAHGLDAGVRVLVIVNTILFVSCAAAPNEQLDTEAWWVGLHPVHSDCRFVSDKDMQFAFALRHLRTNLHFDGQENSVFVRYAYTGLLKDGSDGKPNIVGHPVDALTYPFFQEVKRRVASFVNDYPDKMAFYESLVNDLSIDLLQHYKQLHWVEITLQGHSHPQFSEERAATILRFRESLTAIHPPTF